MITAHSISSSLRSRVFIVVVACCLSYGALLYTQRAFASCPVHQLMLGLESASPVALETGLAQGVGGEYLHGIHSGLNTASRSSPESSREETKRSRGLSCASGWVWKWGGRLAYRGLEEGSRGWLVEHQEWHSRAQIALTRLMGRGSVGLTLGVGGAYIVERQRRHQAQRLSSDKVGSNLEVTDLSYEAQQWVSEVALKPLTQVRFAEYTSGHVGLVAGGEVAWRLVPETAAIRAPLWGWGIHLGLYIAFGGES